MVASGTRRLQVQLRGFGRERSRRRSLRRLADPTRRFVVRCLAEGGTVTATELAERAPVTRQAVTKHLAALHDAGLVERAKDGREMRYGCARIRSWTPSRGWQTSAPGGTVASTVCAGTSNRGTTRGRPRRR